MVKGKQIILSGLVLSLIVAPSSYAQLTTESVTLTTPNGGECLIPGSQIDVRWTGTGFEHVAIGHRTDLNQPPSWQTDFQSWDVHPVFGTSFKWTVPNISSNSVRVWIEAHNSAHSRMALDSSNNTFTISNTCGTGDPPSTTAPYVTQVIIGDAAYKPTDTIEVEKGKNLTIVGTAGASQNITMYVASQEKKFVITANEDGQWTFDIYTTNLTEGLHQVDLESLGSPRVKAFSFTVLPVGSRPTVPQPPSASVSPVSIPADGSIERTSSNFPFIGLGVALGVALLSGLIFFILARKRKHIDETPPVSPPTIL